MSIETIAKGIVIGLSIAAPVGPIGLLCIRRSLDQGMLSGFVTGLGAALADGLYGAIAGFGLSSISQFLIQQARVLGIVGGLYLLYLGVKIARARPTPTDTKAPTRDRLGHALISTFLLTLTNPATILSFVAIFAGVGINLAAGPTNAVIFVIGVVLGSALWWFTLSSGVGLLRHRLGPGLFGAINLVSGVVLIAFGGVALWRGIAG